jgi:hypothetical protein
MAATRSKKKYQGPCELCNSTKRQSQDHIIPKWLVTYLHILLPDFKYDSRRNSRCVCTPCNQERGGGIVIDDPYALEFWLAVRAEIDKEINRAMS